MSIKKWWYGLLGIPEAVTEQPSTPETPVEMPIEAGPKPKKPKAPRKPKVKKD